MAENEKPRPIKAGEKVNPDSVRLEQSVDFDQTGSYRVLAGPKTSPVLVGLLTPEPGLRAGKTWRALTPSFLAAGRGKTRQAALLQLLVHQESTHNDPITEAAAELRTAISMHVGRLANQILGQPEIGTPEGRARDWHLIKIRICREAKVDPTWDVLNARDHGATWADIGEACGTSRQAAYDRWGKHDPKC